MNYSVMSSQVQGRPLHLQDVEAGRFLVN